MSAVATGNPDPNDETKKKKGDGKMMVLDTLGPGACIGELGYLTHQPRVATVRARASDHRFPVMVFLLPGKALRRVAAECAAITANLWRFCGRRLAEDLLSKAADDGDGGAELGEWSCVHGMGRAELHEFLAKWQVLSIDSSDSSAAAATAVKARAMASEAAEEEQPDAKPNGTGEAGVAAIERTSSAVAAAEAAEVAAAVAADEASMRAATAHGSGDGGSKQLLQLKVPVVLIHGSCYFMEGEVADEARMRDMGRVVQAPALLCKQMEMAGLGGAVQLGQDDKTYSCLFAPGTQLLMPPLEPPPTVKQRCTIVMGGQSLGNRRNTSLGGAPSGMGCGTGVGT
jgi:hypothetical protein